jgi:hypothetical protein
MEFKFIRYVLIIAVFSVFAFVHTVAADNRDGVFNESKAGDLSTLESRESEIAEIDRNRDGMVSKEEFSGPVQIFMELDTNDDGFISPDEVQAGHP